MKRFVLIFLFTGFLISAFGQHPDSLWSRSMRSFENHNYHYVVSYMDTLLALLPEFSEGYYNRGIALVNLGNIEGACSDLRHSQELSKNISKEFINYLCDPDVVRNIMLKQFYKNVKVNPEKGYRPDYTRADTLRGALRTERTSYDVKFYDLEIKVMPKNKKISGSNTVYFVVTEPTRRIQVDLFSNYTLHSITWNGNNLAWHREFNAIFIDFPILLNVNESHKISISYEGKPVEAPNPPWEGGFVWKRDANKKPWIGVACEHLGASSWWPNKDHLTDKPDSIQITIEVPKELVAVSNGDLRKTEKAGKSNKRYTWFVEYPINNYNVTLYAGDYVAFSDTLIDGNDTLMLDYNVRTPNLDTAREHFAQTKDVLRFYNKAFGFYPFKKDGFGLVESPYEGMEHQSAIAYGHGYKTNNEQDYRNDLYDYIIVHEAAHEWWGNSVTAKDMADIWIHEGFATYSELMFLEDRFGEDDYLFELADKSRFIFNIWPLVQNRDVNEDAFASNDVYNKGAMMLHCLRCILNQDSLFFAMIHEFAVNNKYKTVNTDDFIQFVQRYTKNDFSAFFKKFLYEITLPVLEYSFVTEGRDLVLKYRWSGVDKGFNMPFGIATDRGESFRLSAGTEWQEKRLEGTAWFNFYNLWKGYAGCPHNAYTYYQTTFIE